MAGALSQIIETRVPARLDRLPWGRFHTLVVAALGITWVLDGIEVTLAGSIAGALEASPSLHFTPADIGLASSSYLTGAVVGALGFGWLTDRLGRRIMFFVTLGLYLSATAATALSTGLISFCLFRFLTGAGIGGEYSAVNSTIQELIPARFRGWTDLAINGSFWIGGALGAAASIFFLSPGRFAMDTGWRLAFFTGAAIGLVIFFLRRWIPESPRWLIIHGRKEEAEKVVDLIEARLRHHGAAIPEGQALKSFALRPRTHTPLFEVYTTLFVVYRARTMVGLALMSAQAFFYNAIFFTYALILTNFYHLPSSDVGWYLLPFSIGNVLGPWLLGPLFDSVGRKPMITLTYTVSGVLLAVSGFLFEQGWLSASEQTVAWTVMFFFASAAAGSAYLTASETFPIEIRALAIAFFYSAGTAAGGVGAPFLFGLLIQTGSRLDIFGGYLAGAALMIAAALVEWTWGVAAERTPLETVARPLSSAQE